MDTSNDYETFLETWSDVNFPFFNYANLGPNLFDPVVEERMLEGDGWNEALIRTPYTPGEKTVKEHEASIRRLDFFVSHQAEWAADFHDRILTRGVNPDSLYQFENAFASDWVDGAKRRQSSEIMLRIKASISEYDRTFHSSQAGKYVITPVPNGITPLFGPHEMSIIFDVNQNLLETYMADYLVELNRPTCSSLTELTIRRGIHMERPSPDAPLRELHYLSSYSLTLSTVEQFSQTWSSSTRGHGVPVIFSAPLPAVLTRVVAFAPFIKKMELHQLEFVIAPPVEAFLLNDHGVHGGIHEYSYE